MNRIFHALVVAAALVAGCAAPKAPMEMAMKKPAPAPELSKLDPLIGTWTGTAEFVSTAPRKEGEKAPEPMKGGAKSEWVMGNMFLREEGWHEFPDGQRANMVEYMTWDPGIKKFRTWYFSDWGEFGEGTMTVDGDTFHVRAEGHSPQGTMQAEGTMTVTDKNTITWSWTEQTPNGPMKIKGTSHRQE